MSIQFEHQIDEALLVKIKIEAYNDQGQQQLLRNDFYVYVYLL